MYIVQFFIGNAKADLFSLGVVDGAILSLQTSSFPHVHFKALGILRLLAQKQSKSVILVTLASWQTTV